MTSTFKAVLSAAALIAGISTAPSAFAQAQPSPAPVGPNSVPMNGQGMMGGQGSMTQSSKGGMNGMMPMMAQMTRMMNDCSTMMESKASAHPPGGGDQGTQHSPG